MGGIGGAVAKVVGDTLSAVGLGAPKIKGANLRAARRAAKMEFQAFKDLGERTSEYRALGREAVEKRLLPNLADDSPVRQAHLAVTGQGFEETGLGAQIDPRVRAGGAERLSGRINVAEDQRVKQRRMDALKLGMRGLDPSGEFGLGTASMVGSGITSAANIAGAEAQAAGLGAITYGVSRGLGDYAAEKKRAEYQEQVSGMHRELVSSGYDRTLGGVPEADYTAGGFLGGL